MTESGVVPRREDRAQCKTCLDEGYIEVDSCACGNGPGWLPIPASGHEPMCGVIPCPEGCADDFGAPP